MYICTAFKNDKEVKVNAMNHSHGGVCEFKKKKFQPIIIKVFIYLVISLFGHMNWRILIQTQTLNLQPVTFWI